MPRSTSSSSASSSSRSRQPPIARTSSRSNARPITAAIAVTARAGSLSRPSRAAIVSCSAGGVASLARLAARRDPLEPVADQLAQEERVAVGPRVQLAGQLRPARLGRRTARAPPRPRAGSEADRDPVDQPLAQQPAAHVAQRVAALELLLAVGRHDQDRVAGQVAGRSSSRPTVAGPAQCRSSSSTSSGRVAASRVSTTEIASNSRRRSRSGSSSGKRRQRPVAARRPRARSRQRGQPDRLDHRAVERVRPRPRSSRPRPGRATPRRSASCPRSSSAPWRSRAWRASSASSRLLPAPASPPTRTSRPYPRAARLSAVSSPSSSICRPTNGSSKRRPPGRPAPRRGPGRRAAEVVQHALVLGHRLGHRVDVDLLRAGAARSARTPPARRPGRRLGGAAGSGAAPRPRARGRSAAWPARTRSPAGCRPPRRPGSAAGRGCRAGAGPGAGAARRSSRRRNRA